MIVDASLREEARRAVLHLAGVLVFGAPLAALVSARAAGYSRAWILVTLGAAITMVVTVVARRMTRQLGELLFAVNAVSATLAALWTTQAFARLGRPYLPFPALKFFVFVVAILSPSGALGAALIALAMLLPVAATSLWWPVQATGAGWSVEPWATIGIGLVSLGVLASRRQSVAVLRELSRARAERRWLARAAHLVLAVRDLTNSPLQTLRLAMALVRTRHAFPPDVVERMNAAVERLRRLNDALAPLDAVVEWQHEDTSFDAERRIEAHVREIHREMSREPRAEQLARRMTEALDPVKDARRAVLQLSCVVLVVSVVGVAAFTSLSMPTAGILSLAGLAAASAALALRARSLPRWASLSLIAVECLSALLVGWNASGLQASRGGPFVPFTMAKMVAILVATFSPSLWLGAGLLGLAALLPLLQASLWSTEVRSRMAQGEPWVAVVFAAASLGLLIARRRSMMAAQEVIRIHAERAWLQRVARLSLAIRRFTISPLHLLRVETRSVRGELADATSVCDRMDSAVTRIQRLSEALTPLESVVDPRPEDTSLDAPSLLDRAVREHLAEQEPSYARGPGTA